MVVHLIMTEQDLQLHMTSPYITIYDTTTTPYTKLSNPTTLPARHGYGCAFNHDGTRLAVAHTLHHI